MILSSITKTVANYLNRFIVRLKIARSPVDYAREIGVKVGSESRFLGLGTETFGSEPYLVSLGDHVTITSGVRFVTHDGGVWVLRKEHPTIDVFGRIDVGNNVFIGLGAIILPGVTIGNNVVIGAGAVVNKSIPENSVAAGVPARVLGSIENYRERMLEIGVPTKGMNVNDKRKFILSRDL